MYALRFGHTRRWLVTSPRKVFSPLLCIPTSMGDRRVLPHPSALSSFLLRIPFNDCILSVSLVVDGTRAQSFPSDFAWFNMEAFDHYAVCTALGLFPPFGFQFSSFPPCVIRFSQSSEGQAAYADSRHFWRCLVSIVHFDSLLRGLPICGNRFLPADCHFSCSLDAFEVFFISISIRIIGQHKMSYL